MKRLIIIDGNAIIHRAYHAIPLFSTKDGTIVNAVYGFASMLLKVWKDLSPEYIVVTFDVAGKTFRHKQFSDYKGTRKKADQELYDQIPLIHDLVKAFNIPIFEKAGYEADDIIGTIVEQVFPADKKQKIDDLEAMIITGDMDTLQLVRPGVKVYTLRKGMSDIVIYDNQAVVERFGFNPVQMIDYKALRGDTSDNIPGVLGIGEKTATELIKKFTTLTEVYKVVKQEAKKDKSKIFKPAALKKLIEGKDIAKMSYELATIDQYVPKIDFKLEDCTSEEFDRDKIVKLFQRFEFFSLLKRLPGENQKDNNIEITETIKIDNKKKFIFKEIETNSEIEELISKIKNKKVFACRELLLSDDLFNCDFLGLSIIVDNYGFNIPEKLIDKILPIFDNKELELIAYDIKKIAKVFKFKKWKLSNKLFDIKLASYILTPGHRLHDSSNIVFKYLGIELPSANEQNTLFGVDTKKMCEELYFLSLTYHKLKKELVDINNLDLLQKVEIPTALILAEMELNGILVDDKMLKKMSEQLISKLKKITSSIYEYADEEFNIGSPTQLRDILFEKMDIPAVGIKKGKTGLSTASTELEKIRQIHPIISEIENWRELTKLQNTYVDVLPKLINKKTGRVHTTFNQAVTATGRLSSSDPNLQNIPARGSFGREIRKAFIAKQGYLFMSIDYSQIELRIVASLAEDRRMIEIFDKGDDIHTATAATINNVPQDAVTKEMRSAAKAINFGILYGMGSYGLSWRAGLTPAEAKEFIKKYFEKFSGVKKYLNDTVIFTKKKGYCETLFGRRRYIPELQSSNFQIRASGERMAVNHPVQGTAADLMKMSMIEVNKVLKKEKSKFPQEKVKLLLQVHDELIFEVEESIVDNLSKLIKTVMESVIKLRVPIVAEVHIAKSWGDLK